MTLVTKTLTEHRAARDLSQLALAKKIDISSGQLAALEAGRDVPSIFTLKKLAKYFKWSASAIGSYVLECDPEPSGPKRLRERS